MDLQGVSPSANAPSISRRRCFRSKAKAKVTAGDREEIAKERWRKVSKLRPLLIVMESAKASATQFGENQLIGKKASMFPNNFDRCEKKFVIYPWSPWKKGFDVLCALLILYFCFATPYHIGFEAIDEPIEYELAFDGVLLIDIVLTFFSAYVNNFEIVDDHRMIASRYLRDCFVFDVISVIPFYLIDSNLMWLKIFRLLHASRLTQHIGHSQVISGHLSRRSMFLDWHTRIHIQKIFNILLYLLILVHVMACTWNYVRVKEDYPQEETWGGGSITSTNMAYAFSLYYIVVTFATIGYGDVTPKTNPEYGFAMFIEFVGIMCYAYLVGNVISIISSINLHDQILSQRESDLDKWLQDLDDARPGSLISPELFEIVKNHFSHAWKHDHSSMFYETEFFMQLPLKERFEMLRMLFTDEIAKFDVFFRGTSREFCFRTAILMSPRKLEEHQTIIEADEQVEDICFILSGSVMLGTRHGTKNFLQLPARSYFGENYILFKTKPNFTYKAGSEGCNLYCVKGEKMEEMLHGYPESMKLISLRALLRQKYFDEMYLGEIGFSSTDHSVLTAEDRALHQAEATRIYKRMEANPDAFTAEEEEELVQVLKKMQNDESKFTAKAVEDMDKASKMIIRMQKTLEDMGKKSVRLQNRYEEDLQKLSEVLVDISNKVPKHLVLQKLRTLEEKLTQQS